MGQGLWTARSHRSLCRNYHDRLAGLSIKLSMIWEWYYLRLFRSRHIRSIGWGPGQMEGSLNCREADSDLRGHWSWGQMQYLHMFCWSGRSHCQSGRTELMRFWSYWLDRETGKSGVIVSVSLAQTRKRCFVVFMRVGHRINCSDRDRP